MGAELSQPYKGWEEKESSGARLNILNENKPNEPVTTVPLKDVILLLLYKIQITNPLNFQKWRERKRFQ